MRTAKLMRTAALVVGVLALARCSDAANADAPAPPQPGTLAVRIAAPDGVGAVRFTLHGTGIDHVRAATAGLEAFSQQDADGWQVAVVGGTLSGDLVLFDVPDVHQADHYDAQVVGMADQNNVMMDGSTGRLVVVKQ